MAESTTVDKVCSVYPKSVTASGFFLFLGSFSLLSNVRYKIHLHISKLNEKQTQTVS